ncbi:helix-turn-helix domain-containing protein [Verminephrobacter eiseniae]|uniref:helix-turn-helix domain-containing protein n=2 Tax=Verminephrobacter eiseniae TaxID=364317 RepID=UPI0010E6A5F4|nr:XRE family transcriptional regulator [Verminephrobacter eiseniae]KAB7552925.1 helix-turn-helix domain-containing protein [Verminephrobacter sp. Larva24]MCW5230804.1 XRE family transcriptional regulator [Verminephrobacter eiseniae]MCW5292537.1 XRE family transcriptional regulator [Verminephrobacter eiseniae]MCW8187094.1 XRE family transcriptional regulator [Verminephrobacter eiseniae]MCW8223511.1 XRE family transcriptional regulator [Verminephrobacter eiseniae]
MPAPTLEPMENSNGTSAPALEESVGAAIRELRLREGLTIAQVSEQAGISRGMLSKIETGSTMAGLDTLARIARTLGVAMSVLFGKYDASAAMAQHVKRGAGMEVVRRGTKSGHSYHLLAYGQGPVKWFEPFLITMADDSQRYPSFQHPGTEFLYMLEGVIEYRCGQQTYVLEPGDALSFDGQALHGPENLMQCPIRFLSIIIYPRSAE